MPDTDPQTPTPEPPREPNGESESAPTRDPASFPVRYLTYTPPAKLFLHALCLIAGSYLLAIILGLPSLDALAEPQSFGFSEASAFEQVMSLILMNLVSFIAAISWAWLTWAVARLIADAIRADRT